VIDAQRDEPRDLVEAVPHEVEEQRVAAGPADLEVELGVRVGRALEARRVLGPVLEGCDRAQPADERSVRALRGPGRGRALEEPAHLEEVLDGPDGDRRDRVAAPGHPLDVALLDQAGEGLAHGGAARVEELRELRLRERHARSEVTVHDAAFDLEVGLIATVLGGGYHRYTSASAGSIPTLSSAPRA